MRRTAISLWSSSRRTPEISSEPPFEDRLPYSFRVKHQSAKRGGGSLLLIFFAITAPARDHIEITAYDQGTPLRDIAWAVFDWESMSANSDFF